jgi:hypothetical protein
VLGDGSPPVTLLLTPLDRDDGSARCEPERRHGPGCGDRAVGAGRGSPFWLDVLARAQGDERDVDDIVVSRIRGLGADAGLLLGTLAIVGRPVDVFELESLVRWPSERLARPRPTSSSAGW